MSIETVDLSRISFFKPVAGKTLREQLRGKKLAGQEVVEHVRSKAFVPPAHWEYERLENSSDGSVHAFSLTFLEKRNQRYNELDIGGFCWRPNFRGDKRTESVSVQQKFVPSSGDVLDIVVDGSWAWSESDWILTIEE